MSTSAKTVSSTYSIETLVSVNLMRGCGDVSQVRLAHGGVKRTGRGHGFSYLGQKNRVLQ